VETFRAVAAFDLVREIYVCGLRLAVGLERVVGFLFEVVVLEANGATAVAEGAHGYHSRWESGRAGGQERGFEELEEVEVADVVDAELHFEAILRSAFGDCHDSILFVSDCSRGPWAGGYSPSVCDEDVQCLALLEELVCGFLDRCEISVVHL
jgi:hypothetical protein